MAKDRETTQIDQIEQKAQIDHREQVARMQELISLLKGASKAYYQEGMEVMSNFEYDALYDELVALEEKLGLVLAGSPSVTVEYDVVSELPKRQHEKPMLSLDKTKEVDALRAFLAQNEGVLSWKMDGLTIVLTYEGGVLKEAVTRGNGEIGELITPSARAFSNLPHTISFKGNLILRGEAVIGYRDFAEINQKIPDAEARYKNPRNLCSGSVRQLNSKVTAERMVQFYAFSLVAAEGMTHQTRMEELAFLASHGFAVVEHHLVTGDTIVDTVEEFRRKVDQQDIPSDGLVLLYNDIAYGKSLGMTAKFPRDAIAFKWKDEVAETTLLEIEWSPSRSGLINPVAIFEPVELEGTTVSRASVHNVSILRALQLGVGDRITVYKANMIIPQIAENITRSDSLIIPTECPACQGETRVMDSKGAQTLYCTNPDCSAKHIKSFTLFVGRNAMDMGGISEATLEKFIAKGYLKEYADLFKLERYQEEIVQMEGFGVKSYDNMIASVQRSRKTSLPRLLYGLGIPGIGVANAKLLCQHYDHVLQDIRLASEQELAQIDGIGEVMAKALVDYFQSPVHAAQLDRLLTELDIAIPNKPSSEDEMSLSGMLIVITGSLNHYASREELKSQIEELGGKVTGSVSKKTSLLINNDALSSSSKNQTAKELGVAILTEEEFIRTYIER